MFHSGIPIQDSTIFRKVYRGFMESYDSGDNIEDISSWLVDRYSDAINDFFDGYPFWYGLAFAQWKVGSLDPAVYARVRDIIVGRKDADIWQYQEPGIKKKRREVVKAFLKMIRTAHPSPRLRNLRAAVSDNILLSLRSPDNQKLFVLYEEFNSCGNARVTATLYGVETCVDIFEYRRRRRRMAVKWASNEMLLLEHDPGIKFLEQEHKVILEGDMVWIKYVS